MSQIPKLNSILENALIVLNGLVLALAIGKAFISLPPFLEVFGRMHPLLLHFPIVLLLLAGMLYWMPDLLGKESKSSLQFLLLLALFFTGLTVIAGLFLSTESGYVQEDLQYHQWTGLLVFWLGSLWYLSAVRKKPVFAKGLSLAVVGMVLVTGHLGASLTHGEDFLFSPLTAHKSTPKVSLDEALAFDHVIKPILEQKCVACHKASKQKGDLRMDEVRFILAGGKNGSILDFEHPEKSTMLERVFLPLEDEEHMPPKGKPQLNSLEIRLLETWILENAAFDKKLTDYHKESEFYALANTLFEVKKETGYDFAFADKKTIHSLNHEYRVIQAIYPESPALRGSYFGSNEFESASLEELKKVQVQLVDLNLQRMPLKDEDLKHLSALSNLENLNLNFTGIQGSGLQYLRKLEKLKHLSLTGNQLSESGLNELKELSQLEVLFMWKTGLDEAQLTALQTALPKTSIEWGYQDDGELYQLNPPEIRADKSVFKDELEINLKHPIGSVRIFYTLDGTVPDSSNHRLYEGPFKIDQNTTIKARAFAAGWLGSQERSAIFLRSGILADQLEFTYPPNERYKGNGIATLFDLEKGEEEFSSGSWLGFRENPMEIKMEFTEARQIQSIAFSLLAVEASHIFPPYKAEVWVTDEHGQEKLHKTDYPEQPDQIREKQVFLLEYPIAHKAVSKIRARLSPVDPLPKWHPGAGEKAWVFIDEILIN